MPKHYATEYINGSNRTSNGRLPNKLHDQDGFNIKTWNYGNKNTESDWLSHFIQLELLFSSHILRDVLMVFLGYRAFVYTTTFPCLISIGQILDISQSILGARLKLGVLGNCLVFLPCCGGSETDGALQPIKHKHDLSLSFEVHVHCTKPWNSSLAWLSSSLLLPLHTLYLYISY